MDTFQTPAPSGRTGDPDRAHENGPTGGEPGEPHGAQSKANRRGNSTPRPPTPTAIKAAINPLIFYAAELTDARP